MAVSAARCKGEEVLLEEEEEEEELQSSSSVGARLLIFFLCYRGDSADFLSSAVRVLFLQRLWRT